MNAGTTTMQLVPAGRKSRSIWLDLTDERVKTLISMRRQRKYLKEIGDALSITPERVRQVINDITKAHGEEVFAPLRWTIAEAATTLQVSPILISRLCSERRKRRPKKSGQNGHRITVTKREINLLRLDPLVTRQSKCVICGKDFTYGYRNRFTHPLTCSADECRAQHLLNCRAKLSENPPTLDTLVGWRRTFWLKRQQHTIPDNEKWLAIKYALKKSGLSPMQLRWLRQRQLVTTKPDPLRTWRGRPVLRFSASEMQLIREIRSTANNKSMRSRSFLLNPQESM